MISRDQATNVFTAICLLVGLLVVVQVWLLSASLESLFAGEGAMALPATLASAVLFFVNGGLLSYVLRLDRRVRGGSQESPDEEKRA